MRHFFLAATFTATFPPLLVAHFLAADTADRPERGRSRTSNVSKGTPRQPHPCVTHFAS